VACKSEIITLAPTPLARLELAPFAALEAAAHTSRETA
jgi:hypothetical protein